MRLSIICIWNSTYDLHSYIEKIVIHSLPTLYNDTHDKSYTHLTVRGDDTAFILRGAKRGFQYSNIYASPTALYIQLVCGRVARLPFKLLESYNGRIWSYKNCALYPTIAQGFNVFDCTLPSFFKHSVLPEDKLWKLISPSLSLSNCPLFVLLFPTHPSLFLVWFLSFLFHVLSLLGGLDTGSRDPFVIEGVIWTLWFL